MKKRLKHLWNIFKVIMIPLVGLNIVPCIFVAVVYFRGTASEYLFGYFMPYATGWSIQMILLFAYFVYKLGTDNYRI